MEAQEEATPIPMLALVVPCYNEQEILPESNKALGAVLQSLIDQQRVSPNSVICYVDDGSADNTWQLISDLADERPNVRGIKLSRNFGHQNALLAGMMSLQEEADCVITIDADLQDDTKCIAEMIDLYRQGNRIVYGVRDNRESDSPMKRFTAEMFYKVMAWMGVDTVYNHADYRLVDRQVIAELQKYDEVNLFLRGVFPLIGFKSAIVTYSRLERTAGETKYPFRKMLNFAWEGITSFTGFPLRLVFMLGCVILVASILLAVWALVPVVQGLAVPGWASIVIPIFLFSGLQMISLGVLGEYLAKVYQEVKARPRFIIEKQS